jgi:hypothetical protein
MMDTFAFQGLGLTMKALARRSRGISFRSRMARWPARPVGAVSDPLQRKAVRNALAGRPLSGSVATSEPGPRVSDDVILRTVDSCSQYKRHECALHNCGPNNEYRCTFRGGQCQCAIPATEAREPEKSADVPAKACLKSFIEPQDGATFVPELKETDGKYTIGLGRSFDMILKFHEDEPGCDCGYGEYRQLVSGQFYGVREMSDGEAVWEEIEHKTAEGPITPGTFVQDSKVKGNRVFAYGHRYRDKARTQLLENTDGDEYQGDRATSCYYHGIDRPRIQGLDPKVDDFDGYVLMLSFRGEAWDIPNQVMRERRTWHVRGGYRLDGTPIPLD